MIRNKGKTNITLKASNLLKTVASCNLKWCGGKNRSNMSSSNLKNVNVNWLSGIVICEPFYTSHIMPYFRLIWKKLHSCLSDVYSLVLYVSVNNNKILKCFINSLKENKYYKSIRTLLWISQLSTGPVRVNCNRLYVRQY